MSNRINPEGKSARAKMRVITRETERLVDKLFARGAVVIVPSILRTQVALNTELPLRDVETIVNAYISAREDLYISAGLNGGIRKRKII